MPSELILRRAGPADTRPLSELFHLAGPHSGHSRQGVPSLLDNPRNVQIVAEQGGRLVSSIAMMHHSWNDSYELGPVLSRPAFCRRGLAPLLMQRVVACVCAEALGDVFFSFRRVQTAVDRCAELDPPMIVAGYTAGCNGANGSSEAQLVILSIPPHARFVHVTPPPVAEGASG